MIEWMPEKNGCSSHPRHFSLAKRALDGISLILLIDAFQRLVRVSKRVLKELHSVSLASNGVGTIFAAQFHRGFLFKNSRPDQIIYGSNVLDLLRERPYSLELSVRWCKGILVLGHRFGCWYDLAFSRTYSMIHNVGHSMRRLTLPHLRGRGDADRHQDQKTKQTFCCFHGFSCN